MEAGGLVVVNGFAVSDEGGVTGAVVAAVVSCGEATVGLGLKVEGEPLVPVLGVASEGIGGAFAGGAASAESILYEIECVWSGWYICRFVKCRNSATVFSCQQNAKARVSDVSKNYQVFLLWSIRTV